MVLIGDLTKECELLAQSVFKSCRDKNKTIAVVESCTGGLVASFLTGVPGASEYFLGGLVVYSNIWKQNYAEVSSEILKAYGAVSEQTARALATGVWDKSDADVVVSITGIAGPDGGSSEKPVGTIFIGCKTLAVETALAASFSGTRQEIRLRTSYKALEVLHKYL